MSDSLRERAASGAAKLKKYGDHDEAAAIEAILARGGWVLLKDSESQTGLSHVSYTMTDEMLGALQQASEEFGLPLPALAEEGYQKVLESDWRPPRVGRVKRPGKKTTLNFKVDAGLRQQVQERLPTLTAECGYRVSESSIVISWLCEELGVDQGLGSRMVLVLPKPLREHFTAAQASGESLEDLVAERVGQLAAGTWTLPWPGRAAKGSWEGVTREKLSIRVDETTRETLHAIAPELSERLGVRVYPGTIVRAILTDRFGEPTE